VHCPDPDGELRLELEATPDELNVASVFAVQNAQSAQDIAKRLRAEEAEQRRSHAVAEPTKRMAVNPTVSRLTKPIANGHCRATAYDLGYEIRQPIDGVTPVGVNQDESARVKVFESPAYRATLSAPLEAMNGSPPGGGKHALGKLASPVRRSVVDDVNLQSER
jgi:hypothetical protein